MTPFVTIVGIFGLALVLFGGWGRWTEAGRRKYDEMAGMIPFFAYYAGLVLLAVAVVLAVFRWVKG